MLVSRQISYFFPPLTFVKWYRNMQPCFVSSRQAYFVPRLQKLRPPRLSQSINLYIESIKHLVPANQWKKTLEIATAFQAIYGEGERLQQLLEQRADQVDNWLSDYWLSCYLGYRVPVVVHSNPAVWMPQRRFNSDDEWLAFATCLVSGAIDYKICLDTNKVKVDMMKNRPACMSQNYTLFGNCRIPNFPEDLVLYRYGGRFNARFPVHVCVFFRNYVYRVQVIDDVMNLPVHPHSIFRQLKAIVHSSSSSLCDTPVGLFTSLPRDDWYNIYCGLKQDPINVNTFEAIQQSLFVLCLDESLGKPRMHSNASTSTNSSNSNHILFNSNQTLIASNNLHGGGTNSGNRWFDKSLSFIVSRDGGVGVNFEHTAFDGHVIIAVVEKALKLTKDLDLALKPDDELRVQPRREDTWKPVQLRWKIGPKTEDQLHVAENLIFKLVDETSLECAVFTAFGKEWIKSATVSPDAFVQIALQLTYARSHPERLPPPTYESGSLRRFYLGRTEAIRSCSQESFNFTKAMNEQSVSKEKKRALLLTAIKKHCDYTELAISGNGYDRHLFGLKKMADICGMQCPSLFSDPTFGQSNHFKLSTSQISSSWDIAVCFGAVTEDGYGFCYNIQDNKILVSASSFKPAETSNDPKQFIRSFSDSLLDMQRLLSIN